MYVFRLARYCACKGLSPTSRPTLRWRPCVREYTSKLIMSEQCNRTQTTSVSTKPVVLSDSVYEHESRTWVKDLVGKVRTLIDSNIDISTHTSYESLLLSLVTSEHKTHELNCLLKEEIESKVGSLRLSFLPKILSTLRKENCINKPILKKSSERVHHVIQNDPDNIPDNFNFGQILWVLGKSMYYNQLLCESLLSLFKRKENILTPWTVGNVAWYCARIQHYDSTLLDRISEYTLRNLNNFSQLQMSNVVYSLGQLNHPQGKEVLEAVGERLENEAAAEDGAQIYWVYMWTSMVLNVLRPSIVTHVLRDRFIKASKSDGKHLGVLLQLSVAMNYEHRELGLAGTKSIPSRWGEGFDSIQNVNTKHIRDATLYRLDKYKAGGSASMFSENVKRALLQVLGEDFFISEPITLSGYRLDFEVLLDSNHKPVRIPRRWKRQWKESVIRSISPGRTKVRKKLTQISSLIENLENIETNNTSVITSEEAVMASKFDLRMRINLASDWGSKFEAFPQKVARRIAVEVDGSIHFAANSDHPVGRTVIKHRQLRALGWEVLQIPFQEWEELEDGDAHAEYLAQRILGTPSN